MNLALQPFGICSMVISRIKPFYIINSASSSFHSLFHVTLSLPCRCHGTLSFQVFRLNSSGLTQRDCISVPPSHVPKFIISTPCLMIRLTFHVNRRTFHMIMALWQCNYVLGCRRAFAGKATGCVMVELPWSRAGLAKSYMIQTQ